MSIEEVKTEFLNKVAKGAKCPCCNRFTKVYKRKLNSGMAKILIEIYMKYGNQPVHISKEFLEEKRIAIGNEYSKLRYWGLLVKMSSGEWLISDTGIAFVKGLLKVPRHVFLCNGELIKMGTEFTDVKQALGDKFDYAELMSGT